VEAPPAEASINCVLLLPLTLQEWDNHITFSHAGCNAAMDIAQSEQCTCVQVDSPWNGLQRASDLPPAETPPPLPRSARVALLSEGC
jgi:hypothetical protein